VTINGTDRSSLDTIIKNGDIISHTLHRHEPPVTEKSIGIVHEDDNLIVINKPSGMPVHPAGRYNFNSVVEIMRAERDGLNPLRECLLITRRSRTNVACLIHSV